MTATRLDAGREFLARRRFALVGASREEKSFSRHVLRELIRKGYDVVPVNPALAEVEGRRCFPRVQDVVPPVDAALLMTPPARTADAVRDCVAAGVRRVWMHRGGGPGAASPEAIALCEAAGIAPIVDLCPFMALPGAGWFHRLHGRFRGVHRESRRAIGA
ncbi:CoA-binding protein [Anaeromyxobacter oryzae]|uniref:CoA-binding protein n=1 Tax=Anaeromyxobacter oryzae TaxID=2918170 RepID=A0ABM7WP68_9BACT|nr:CoA-binding protein [Anaeromyxobacter oryzae]BDG01250.1 CoA-binding protein [Anaeromyxobacter oryzae]